MEAVQVQDVVRPVEEEVVVQELHLVVGAMVAVIIVQQISFVVVVAELAVALPEAQVLP